MQCKGMVFKEQTKPNYSAETAQKAEPNPKPNPNLAVSVSALPKPNPNLGFRLQPNYSAETLISLNPIDVAVFRF